MLPRRLHFQSLTRPRFALPEDVVEWFGAVQSQDFPAAKWAVAQRTTGADDAALERAFNAGTILRTHVLRPTWHFVPARDIRWMLELTAQRIRSAIAHQGRWLGLDPAKFPRDNRKIASALSGGRQLTRAELGSLLRYRGVALGHVIMQAECNGLICSGALRGKQHTYALLNERVPATRSIEREEALALLAWRYFRSHGPATLKDFVWWSGLTTRDAKQAIADTKGLVSETIGGIPHWLSDTGAGAVRMGRLYLLPNFDEFLVAYADRKAAYDGPSNVALTNTVVFDGRVVGTWKRTFVADAVRVRVNLFEKVPRAKLQAQVQRFGTFLGRTASFQV